MEVNKSMMDQLLVNTAPQPGGNPNVKAPKDADGSDFNSMVHQRRTADRKAGTGETKDAKPDGAPEDAETAKTEEPVADAQYAIAAAMMYQAQPDTRYTMVAGEDAEARPQQAVEAVQGEQAEAELAELPETPEVGPENLAGPETEVGNAAVNAPREETALTQPEAGADAPKLETPETQTAETAPEARETESARAETREAEPAPRETERAPRAEDAPRTDRTEGAARRSARAEARETVEARTDDARNAQEAPLFERVDTTVVKVAEAPRSIPLEAENGVEQLGEELNGILVSGADLNRVELTLTPEHLGKLTIEISRGENGALSVVLHASTERAAALLERGVNSLQSLLTANAGNNGVRVEVRPAEESQQQFLNPDGQNEQGREQQQQQNGRRQERQSAQDFLQQLRLGLVDREEDAE